MPFASIPLPTYKFLAILAPPSTFKTPPLVKLVALLVVNIDNVSFKNVNVLKPVTFPSVPATNTCPWVNSPDKLPAVIWFKRWFKYHLFTTSKSTDGAVTFVIIWPPPLIPLVTNKSPLTVNVDDGAVVPIPILPALLIRKRSFPTV